MDELLNEINATSGEKDFIQNISGKGADHDFIARRQATLTFYAMHKTKSMIESLKAVVDHVSRSVNDINKSTLEAAEKIAKSYETAAQSAEKHSKRMTRLTVVLSVATLGLFFVGIVQLITM